MSVIEAACLRGVTSFVYMTCLAKATYMSITQAQCLQARDSIAQEL